MTHPSSCARTPLRRPGRRAYAALAAVACCAIAASGCGSSRTGSPTSLVAQHHLEADVVAVMNHNGQPVMDSYIACKVDPDGLSQTCLGQTDGANADEIEGDFVLSSPRHTPGSCPGSLTVKLKGVEVDKVRVDPCR